MAITPLWIATGDVRTNIEMNLFIGGYPTSSTSKAFTGSYSLRAPSNTALNQFGKQLPTPSTHMRMGYYINYTDFRGFITTDLYALFGAFYDTLNSEVIFSINRRASTNELVPMINGVALPAIGTIASLGLDVIDVWRHFGLICEVGNPGYAALYLNGVNIWDYTGLITGTMDRVFIEAYYGGASTENGWAINSAYYDDIYLDDITGEPNTAPPAYRFLTSITNGVGANAQWDSTSASNWQAVDDNPYDGESTFNSTDINTRLDTFNTANIVVPVGYDIVMAHPYAIARRTGGTDAIKLILHSYDGMLYKNSTPKDLIIDYSLVFDSQPTQPDNTAWDQTDFNNMQFGYESDGF